VTLLLQSYPLKMFGVALSAVCGNRICKLKFFADTFGSTLSCSQRQYVETDIRSKWYLWPCNHETTTKGLRRVTRAFDFLRAEEQSNPFNVNIIPRTEETGLQNHLLLKQWEQSFTKYSKSLYWPLWTLESFQNSCPWVSDSGICERTNEHNLLW